MRLLQAFTIFQKVSTSFSTFRHDYTGIRNLQVFKIYKKIFGVYVRFPYSYDSSTQRFHVTAGKDLLYSFHLTELVILVSIILILLELVNIAHAEKIAILPLVLLLISFILLTFDFLSAVAISFVKREIVAFYNDFFGQVELLERGTFLWALEKLIKN